MFFFLVVAAVVVVVYYKYEEEIGTSIAAADRKSAPLKAALLPMPGKFREILAKYFLYYQKLSPEKKVLFEKKVAKFLYSKRFFPRDVSEVTIEAKVLISASAVQLTFGLPEIYLDHFNKILIYSNDYYSSITKRYHKGEVNPRFGIIVISWQSFIDGYIYPTDSFNLGLHEMAHALRLENIIRSEEYKFFDEDTLQRLDKFAHHFCSSTDVGHEAFLRSYACTDVHEFFSVAVENFFERPEAMKEHLPELYAILKTLLNQDPLVLDSGKSDTEVRRS